MFSQVKMNRMRQRIAERLKESQNECAMLTTFNEIDMRYVSQLQDPEDLGQVEATDSIFPPSPVMS